ncbi:MAG: efflux transporter periplasmic adaptor subunit [Deltaproteobacteria bacterium CG_4_8_14_3_um_filter_51_11]|nr:MAG: efflux transporter periplasmic adaptor subunit [Desulfobacteraceae bacterium CG2_30_51_40]PIP45381.1 MAG: efflux transporter periplasmic adaptor subunit [Deltaproteobacteria bacterium CG23_combo_of_CG06-09_8_20_14_all_51_20]PIX20552.1 MAG: efflux transporter periplasmic adaptor subunit [Deltaproteobacteria bacterium CG_4_8_14_3_um_filter_51_11]PIY22668.1 MAG: efflux transporter periplasmic adaptor subunit [Deltaproteobacteria bacterium CG_4_10_14_3_um_filter_51_14]PJB36922.1 MAG: efflux
MKSFSGNHLIPALLLAFVFLSGLMLNSCERGERAQPPPRATEVAVVPVQLQKVVLTTELPGRTSSFRMAEIRPQVSGLIQKRIFEEGTDVKEGQLLYLIDPAPFKAALGNAEANLAVARKAADRARAGLEAGIAGLERYRATLDLAHINLKRFEEAFRDKAVSANQRDQAVSDAKVAQAALIAAEAQVKSDREGIALAEASIQQAEAALQSARINIGYTRVTAPISGRIGKSNVTEGAIVTGYQPLALASIQQLDPVYLDVPQSTAQLLRLKRRLQDGRLSKDGENHSKVKLLLEDGSEYPPDGELQFRDVTVDPTTGTVILRIVFPNPEGTLLPGMFVRALVKEGVNERAILIPQQAVSRGPKGNPIALIVEADGKVSQRMLSLDRSLGDKWLVSSGLQPGDQVIAEGMQKVRPGSTVKVVSFDSAVEGRAKPDDMPRHPEKKK